MAPRLMKANVINAKGRERLPRVKASSHALDPRGLGGLVAINPSHQVPSDFMHQPSAWTLVSSHQPGHWEALWQNE